MQGRLPGFLPSSGAQGLPLSLGGGDRIHPENAGKSTRGKVTSTMRRAVWQHIQTNVQGAVLALVVRQ
jgi:hypothetical protein